MDRMKTTLQALNTKLTGVEEIKDQLSVQMTLVSESESKCQKLETQILELTENQKTEMESH